MQHLDDGTLQAWLDQARSGMDEARHEEIRHHLAKCGKCGERLTELGAMTLRVQSLLLTVEPPAGDIPEWGTVVARAGAHETAERRRPVWTAASWAAGVAAVMGLGWLSNDLYRGADTARNVTPPTSVEDAAAPPSVADAPVDSETPKERVAEARPDVARPATPVVATVPGPSVLRGRVTDESGRPLAAAQVVVRGTNMGTLTNQNGAFALSLPDTATGPDGRNVTLTAQLIGYGEASRALIARAGDTVSADLQMSRQALSLDAVVVTGTSVVTREEADPGRRGLVVSPAESTWGEPWTTASRSEAEGMAGFPILVVDDLPVIDISVGTAEGAPVVRIIQELDGGPRLTLLEARGVVSFLDETQTGDARSAASTRRGDVGIAARAPIPMDSLNALLQRLR